MLLTHIHTRHKIMLMSGEDFPTIPSPAPGAVAAAATRHAPGPSAGPGAHLSAGDVLNGEPSGMTGRIVTTPSVTIRPTTKVAGGNGTEAPCDPGTPSDAEASTEAPVPPVCSHWKGPAL